jgi:hypothetical protein
MRRLRVIPADKPGSVGGEPPDDHSSWSAVTRALQQPTRSVLIEPGRLSLPIWPFSYRGLPVRALLPGALWALTPLFSPLPDPAVTRRPSAVLFLWHYPSREPLRAQALPGGLPCGARTFLGIASAIVWPESRAVEI